VEEVSEGKESSVWLGAEMGPGRGALGVGPHGSAGYV